MSVITDYCKAYGNGEITFERLRQLMRQVIPRPYGWDSDQYDYQGYPEENPYSLEYTFGELDVMTLAGVITLEQRETLREELFGDPLPGEPVVDLNAEVSD